MTTTITALMMIPMIDSEMTPSFLACGGSETAAELAATVQISTKPVLSARMKAKHALAMASHYIPFPNSVNVY